MGPVRASTTDGTVAVPARSTYTAQPICLSIADALSVPRWIGRTDGRSRPGRTATPRKIAIICPAYVRRWRRRSPPLLCCCCCYGTCPWVLAKCTHATSMCPTRRLMYRYSVPLTVGLYDNLNRSTLLGTPGTCSNLLGNHGDRSIYRHWIPLILSLNLYVVFERPGGTEGE